MRSPMIPYLKRLTSRDRSETSDRHLAYVLTFVAGAANAGGFMAVRQYTSHMSGIVSAMADNFALGNFALVLAGFAAFAAFVLGAACSAILIRFGRRHDMEGEYALPLVVEAALLSVFGLLGARFEQQTFFFVSVTVILLCFIMGLQNAIITKLSNSRIRTTHVTGLVTDIGIELGKLAYINMDRPGSTLPPVRADKPKLVLFSTLVALFFSGGVIGAVVFAKVGFPAALYLAAIVWIMAIMPVYDDLRRLIRPHS